MVLIDSSFETFYNYNSTAAVNIDTSAGIRRLYIFFWTWR